MSKANATHYVFSTLTASQTYTRTASGPNDLPRTVAEVYIAGGANVPDKYLRTPAGVMTPVTDEELAVLQENPVFQLHEKNGFVTIKSKPYEPEKVAAEMTHRDDAAPLTEQDFAEEEAPKINAPAKNNRKA